MRMYANGVVFNSSSIFWISGILTLLLGTVSGTTRIITAAKMNHELQLRIIKDYKVTLTENVPHDFDEMMKEGHLINADLSSVKHVIVSGYKYSFSVLEEFNSHLPNGNLHNVYGLTELGDVSVDFPKFRGKDTAGQLVNGVSVKIIDEEGKRCGVGVDGEVCVKSRFRFLGYYKNEELTNEYVDSEGFFLTGDIGHMDGNGYLYIADRKKNVINHADDWIFPSEIEEVLLKSPDIKSVCIVGVPHGPIFELPAAFVVRANDSRITEDEIYKMVEGEQKLEFRKPQH